MAITIVSEPTTYEPVYNYLNYKVTSTNSANAGFKYIYNVYVNSVLIYTAYAAASPDSAGYPSIGRVLESYLTNDGDSLLVTGVSRTLCLNSYVDGVQLKVGEQYLVSGVVTNYPDLTTSSTIYPFNGSLTYLDRAAYLASNFTFNNTVGSNRFLTNMPNASNVYRDQNQYLTFIRSSVNVNGMQVSFYDEDGGSLGTAQITLQNDVSLVSGRIVRINAGLNNLKEVSNTHFVAPFNITAILNDIYSYTIFVYNTASNNKISELFTFNVKDRTCKYEGKEIFFQNRFGAFESFLFSLVSTESASIEKATYSKNNVYSKIFYSSTDRIKTSIGNITYQKFTVTSDWINEEESNWLLELIESPVCYVNYNDTLLPINITTNSYETFTRENKKLFNIKLEYEYTFVNDTQR